MHFLSVCLKVLLATASMTLCQGQHPDALDGITATGKMNDRALLDHAKMTAKILAVSNSEAPLLRESVTKLTEQLKFGSTANKNSDHAKMSVTAAAAVQGPSLASGAKSHMILPVFDLGPFLEMVSFPNGARNPVLVTSNPTGFRIEDAPANNGLRCIINQENDYCLGTTDNTTIIQSPCNGQLSQQWLLVNSSTTDSPSFFVGYIMSVPSFFSTSGILVMERGGDNDGAPVALSPWNLSFRQQWMITMQGEPIKRSLGCFVDSSNRAFSKLLISSNSMTVERCGNLALANGYRYFGVEFGSECYATDSGYDTYGSSSNCNTPCSGDSSQTCGGTWAISAYAVYPQFVPYCDSSSCVADNNEWCRNDQNLVGCLNDRSGLVALDGTWCSGQDFQACMQTHGGYTARAVDGTWCGNDGNTMGCLEAGDHIPIPKPVGEFQVVLINDAHSCAPHYTVYRESCNLNQICSGNLAPRGQRGAVAYCHYDKLTPVRICIRFEQQIGGDCTVSDTQTTVGSAYKFGHFSGSNAWAGGKDH